MVCHARTLPPRVSAVGRPNTVCAAKPSQIPLTPVATKSAPGPTEPWTALTEKQLLLDLGSEGKTTLDLQYLRPLARAVRGDPYAESLVSRVTKGRLDVASLSKYVETHAEAGAYPLEVDRSVFKGKYVSDNYKSAMVSPREVSKSVRKRVSRGQTLGPYSVADIHALGLQDYAVNSIGAVAKRGSTDMRPVD